MARSRDIASTGPRPPQIADQQEIGKLSLAWGHAMWRNNLVAKVFCYLSVMRAARIIPPNSRALISPFGRKVPQDYQSTGNNQAAHYLPGFVAIEPPNGAPLCLWEMAMNDQSRRKVEDIFRATQDLNVSYNRADSAAEVRRLLGPPGLKQLFRECCQFVIDQRPLTTQSGEALTVIDRPMVARTFRRWAEGSIEAYRAGAAGKSGRTKKDRPDNVRDEPRSDLPAGVFREWTAEDLAARIRDDQRIIRDGKGTVQEFAEQESFLRAYANVTSGQFPLSDAVIHEVEAPFEARREWLLSNSAV